MNIKKILISQPEPTGRSPYHDVAARHGVEVTFRSFIKIEGLTTREFRDQRINILDHTAIIFTTRKAMEHFFELSKELRVAMPDTMKYFCISEQVALYLQKFITYRKRKVFFPESGNLEGLAALIYKHAKEKYFIPAPEEHKTDLQALLDAKKVFHSTGIMFRTVPAELTAEERAESFDMYIFFTPIGVTSLKRNYPDFEQGDIRIAAHGPATARAVEDSGLRLDLIPTSETPSMVLALDEYLAREAK